MSGWLMSLFYDRVMAQAEVVCLGEWRRRLLSGVSGRVLEIGPGTGANLPHYPPAVREVLLVEPDPHMRGRLEARLVGSGLPGRVLAAPAERLPVEDESVDAVVSTLVFCSVSDPSRTAAEIWRVLRPGGTLFFLEHIAAEAGSSHLRWQQRVEPIWRRFTANCHLTRQTETVLDAAGFELHDVVHESIRRVLPVVRPSIRGHARKPS